MRPPLPDAGCRPTRLAVITATCWLGLLSAAQAQTATTYGCLGNFDVVNNTGQEACGFEAEIEGLPPGYPVVTFTSQRYGAPLVTDRSEERRVGKECVP